MHIYKSAFGDITPREMSITERVFESLEARAGDPLITDGLTGQSYTASEFQNSVRRLAGGIVAAGHAPGTVLAIMAPNCPDYAVFVHGAAFAGCTVTTINPTYTAPEIRQQLTDSGARLLVTNHSALTAAREAAQGTDVAAIYLIDAGTGAPLLTELYGEALDTQVPVDFASMPVLLPYSSGTTGLPKGVMLTHRNLASNVEQASTFAPVEPGDVTIVFLPFFHIYGLGVLLNTFIVCGGSLVTMPRFDLETFLQLTEKHRARTLYMVPPVALALAMDPRVDEFDLSALEVINCAAAPLGADIVDQLSNRLGCTVLQGYGMTETSPTCHVHPVDAPRSGSVGMLIPSTECRIVDPETGEDAAPGDQGEIWIRGPQVMKGYLNNPTATAQAITPEGWLKTGDIGYVDCDGYLFIADRLKELIKVKGFQVAPAEVEAALLTHPDVRDVAVVGAPDPDAGEVPVAFVVGIQGPPDEASLRAHLDNRLAHYKQVRRYIFRDSIPKSTSGKILRRLLRDELAAEEVAAPVAE